MEQTLTASLWADIGDIYQAILKHPFVTGLTDGSLPTESFAFYVVQDALFLRRYAQSLAAVASKAPRTADTEMFARHSAGIVTAEMSLHDSLMAELDISPAELDTAEEAPTNLAYTSYLLAHTQGGSYAEGIGTVLPCYWIYWEVGKHLVGQGSVNPRYQKWIDTYSGDEFGTDVQEVIAVADKLTLSADERELVRRHFRATSRYEWMFWDMGYHRQSWPV
jgi:thiaminase (transcriptional activator TenA)